MAARVAIAARLWRPTPFAEVAPLIAEAGYAGVEGVGDLVGKVGLARHALRDAGLKVAGGYYPANWFASVYRNVELDQLRRAGEFFAELGAQDLITGSLPVPERMATAGHAERPGQEGLSDEQWSFLADSLAMATFVMRREFDLNLLFRNQLGSYVETADELERLIGLTDPNTLYLAPDVGYLVYAGIEPLTFLRKHWNRVRYITLKDVDRELRDRHVAEAGDLDRFVAEGGFVELGAGSVELDDILAFLLEKAYDGWVVVDQDLSLRDPIASAHMSRDFLAGFGL